MSKREWISLSSQFSTLITVAKFRHAVQKLLHILHDFSFYSNRDKRIAAAMRRRSRHISGVRAYVISLKKTMTKSATTEGHPTPLLSP
jgi:hypothetical protein